MKNTAFFRNIHAIIGVLLLATVWFGILEWLYPRYFLWDDNATYYLPLYVFNADALRTEHSIPLINFYQFAGWNHVGAGQSGVLYPLAYVATWIATDLLHDALWTIDVLTIIHMVGGMLGLYWWLSLLKMRRTYAMGAVAYYLTFPFTTILSKAWVVVSNTHCFVPLCFAALERDLRKPSLGNNVLYVGVKTLYLLQGYVQYVAYFSLFEMLYIALRQRSGRKRKYLAWKRYIQFNLQTVILGMPLLLPMTETMLLSAYRSHTMDLRQAISGMVDVMHLFYAQVFHFYEAPVVGNNHLLFLSMAFVLPWIIWHVCRLRIVPTTTLRIILYMAMTALLFCGPLSLVLHYVPIFDRFRWPFKFFYFFGLFYIISFFFFLQLFSQRRKKIVRWNLFIASLAIAGNVALLGSPPRAFFTLSQLQTNFSPPHAGYRSMGLWPSNRKEILNTSLPAFNYPTLWRQSVAGGYDPLISTTHYSLMKNENNDSLLDPAELQKKMDQLSQWSVRYLLTLDPVPASIRAAIPSLRLITANPTLMIYENRDALPVVSFQTSPRVPLSFEYGVNRLRIQTQGTTGNVRVRVAPIAGYFAEDTQGHWTPVDRDEQGLLLSVGSPRPYVEIMYRSLAFEWGVLVALIGILFFGLHFFVRRMRMPKAPPGEGLEFLRNTID